MDDKHRKVIKDNIRKLVQHTNFEKIIKACQEEFLLSERMVENLYLDSKNLEECGRSPTLKEIQHQKLFEKITHRGPEAFHKLIKILKDLDNVEALQILEREREFICLRESHLHLPRKSTSIFVNPIEEVTVPVVPNTLDNPDNLRTQVDQDEPLLKEFSDTVHPKEKFEVKKADRIHTNDRTGTYKMQSKDNRGVLFIANFIKTQTGYRYGAENDSDSLIYVFKQLGFKIFITTNSSQKVFFDLLEQLLKSDYTRKTECFILALMTHGELDSKDKECVEFSDGSIVKVEEIRNRFSNDRCPNLIDKPKVLIFPFCRGQKSDTDIRRKIETDSMHSKDNIVATMSDLLICYAANPGYKAHRDPCTGSWYVQELCKIIAQHAHNTDFEDIIKKVQAQVGAFRSENNEIQTGNFVNIGFDKTLFFNPGYPSD